MLWISNVKWSLNKHFTLTKALYYMNKHIIIFNKGGK